MQNSKLRNPFIFKLITLTFNFLLLTFYLIPVRGYAMCPVCTVGVIAGLGLSRWLGIDDTVSGIWIGGILASVSGWTNNWLKNKKWNFKGSPIIIPIIYYGAVVVPLYTKEIIGHPFNTLWGIDKLMLGIIIGTLFFVFGAVTYNILKQKNGGKAHFPFEKVVLPVAPLIILSVIFYYVTRH